MLQIDLKPSRLNKRVLLNEGVRERNMSAQNLNAMNTHHSVTGLNSYNSLNRAVRIKDMAKIVEDNKLMLKKLQTASSFYSIDKWEQDNKKKKKLVKNLCRNSDRF
jgi:inosine/xanthosine triphosphate pyrophosphatase family protein